MPNVEVLSLSVNKIRYDARANAPRVWARKVDQKMDVLALRELTSAMIRNRSLKDFRNCRVLTELYLRKNNVRHACCFPCGGAKRGRRSRRGAEETREAVCEGRHAH